MDFASAGRRCLQLPGVTEEYPFGPDAAVFKVCGKMFALVGVDYEPLRVSLKCEPDLARQLRESYPAVQPGYHMNKRHWNTITCDETIPDDLLADWIVDSYDLVVEGLPKRARDRLQAT